MVRLNRKLKKAKKQLEKISSKIHKPVKGKTSSSRQAKAITKKASKLQNSNISLKNNTKYSIHGKRDHPQLVSSRYFEPTQMTQPLADSCNPRDQFGSVCCFCGKSDHGSFKNCPEQVCFNCGKSGHVKNECPYKTQNQNGFSKRQQKNRKSSSNIVKKCSWCHFISHNTANCPIRKFNVEKKDLEENKVIQCFVCLERGHLNCSQPLKEKGRRPYCFNCGARDHFGMNCPKDPLNFSSSSTKNSRHSRRN